MIVCLNDYLILVPWGSLGTPPMGPEFPKGSSHEHLVSLENERKKQALWKQNGIKEEQRKTANMQDGKTDCMEMNGFPNRPSQMLNRWVRTGWDDMGMGI